MIAKVSKTYNILLRLIIVVLTLFFLYDQLFYRKDLQSIIDFFPAVSADTNFLVLLILAALFIPLNLFLEIVKWKLLIGKIEIGKDKGKRKDNHQDDQSHVKPKV